jgi:multicomponent Na+:H+ antiporter subunit C
MSANLCGFCGAGGILLFGVVARRGAAAGFGADPVSQALVITGMVVAFAAASIGVALLLRLDATGVATLDDKFENAGRDHGEI